MKYEEFASPGAMYAEATRILNAGIARAGSRFAFALSGGSTPLGWFDELERHWRPPPKVAIDVYWVDERQVPFDHPDSNYGNAKRHWPGLARLRPHPLTETYPDNLQLDQAWLGMGNDGHTASWFPGETAWQHAASTVIAVPAPQHIAPHLPRLTLTPRIVLNAAEIVLMIAGPEKRAALAHALDPASGSPVSCLHTVFERLTVLSVA